MFKNINEGFVSEFIKGFKDGYKSVINKSKSNGLTITDTVIKYQDGPVKYVLLVGDSHSIKDDDSNLLYSISAEDAEKYPIMGWSTDDWETFEVVDPRSMKTLETIKTGKHAGPEFNFNSEIPKITKVLNKYNLKSDSIKEVVNNILAGVPVREALNEAYKTVNFVQTNKDLKNKSAGIATCNKLKYNCSGSDGEYAVFHNDTGYKVTENDEINNVSEVKILGASLLSREQFYKLPTSLRSIKESWWLSTGSDDKDAACCVDRTGSSYFEYVDKVFALRPGLILNTDIAVNTEFTFAGKTWIVILPKFAICKYRIGKAPFNKNREDGNVYDYSFVKDFIHSWFLKYEDAPISFGSSIDRSTKLKLAREFCTIVSDFCVISPEQLLDGHPFEFVGKARGDSYECSVKDVVGEKDYARMLYISNILDFDFPDNIYFD